YVLVYVAFSVAAWQAATVVVAAPRLSLVRLRLAARPYTTLNVRTPAIALRTRRRPGRNRPSTRRSCLVLGDARTWSVTVISMWAGTPAVADSVGTSSPRSGRALG